MSTSLKIEGLAELRAALEALPTELATESAEYVDHTTEITASSLRQSYPKGDTGNLRAGVDAIVTRSRFGAIGVVVSKSPHASLWEFGTVYRYVRAGWRRGEMPEHRIGGLIAIATRNRARLVQQQIELVTRAGFTVT